MTLLALTAALPGPAAGSLPIGTAEVLSLQNDPTDAGPLTFFGGAPVLSPVGSDVLVRILVGEGSPSPSIPALLGGGSRPLATVARQGQVVPGGGGETIQSFENPTWAHGMGRDLDWFLFKTSGRTGIAARDTPLMVAAGLGANDIEPGPFVANGEWLAIVEINPGTQTLNAVTTFAPFQEITNRVIAVGDDLGGRTVTAINSIDPVALNPTGWGTTRVGFGGLNQTIVFFDAATGEIDRTLGVDDQAPGFPPPTDFINMRSAAPLNAAGYTTFRASVFGSSMGVAEVIYVLGPDGQRVGLVQQNTQVPDAASGIEFTLLGTPIMGPTGAVFVYQQRHPDTTTVPALGFIDLQGGFRTLALANTEIPGAGVISGLLTPFAMNPLGLLVARANFQGGGSAYLGLDTTDPEASFFRIIGTGDQVMVDGESATILGIGSIPFSGGEDGRPTALNATHLAIPATLDQSRPTVLRVNVVELAGPTSTPTGSGTPSATITPTPSVSTTPTPTPSISATPTVSPTPTPSSVQDGTSTPTRTPPPSSTPSGMPISTQTPTFPPPPTPTSPADLDYGDAPDELEIPGRPLPRYPTLFVHDGARHEIVDGFFLGQAIDAEEDGQPNEDASLDDTTSSPDDEDGVTLLTALERGGPARIEVVASLSGRLDAWIDFNGDGDWLDSGEQVFAAFELEQGPNELEVQVPLSAASGVTFARFRFSTLGGLSFVGLALEGEVEDYAFTIVSPLDGDASCDRRVSAADLPALLQGIGTGGRAACGFDDANRDDVVDAADVDAAITAIFAF